MDYNGIELHDARLVSISTDYAARRVVIAIEYWPATEASVRVRASIQFDGVTYLNELSDLDELESHASPGNIAYWTPATGAGTTYIHLVQGLISVTANALAFVSDV